MEAASDPDTATAQTIQLMCGQVWDSARDAGRDTFTDKLPMLERTARVAVRQFAGLGGGLPTDAASLAGAAFWWCKLYVKFVHHEFIIRQRLGESGHLQGLISPELLVRMAKPEGDCAIFSECVAAFLTVYGIPFEFVTAAVNPSEPEIFSHVYLYAVLPDGTRLPLDASHGKYPGWQVPSAHVSRRQVWDSEGNPIKDSGSRFDGLHNYGMRGLGVMVWDEFAGGYYEDGQAAFGTAANPVTANPLTVPSQNSAAWAGFANSLKGVLTLAQMYALKPGMQVLPNGTVMQQNPGYPIGTPTGAFSLGTGAISTTTLMLGGLALVAILFMSGRK